MRRNAGFTLVELLVVVLIIGILAAVAVPQYFKVVEKGRVTEATSCASILNSAEERYFLKNNAYTTNQGDLDAGAGTVCTLKYFNLVMAAGGFSWTATFTRSGTTPPVYGAYSFSFTAGNSTQPYYTASNANVSQDLLP